MSEGIAHDEWTDRLVADKAWVIHVPTGTVGRVVKSEVVDVRFPPVLEFEEGHTFHAKREADFQVLSEREAHFYGVCVEMVSKFVFEIATLAAHVGVGERAFSTMIASALRAQVRALGNPGSRSAPVPT
jgi:hypothetical protein